jgi:hypothetical protein
VSVLHLTCCCRPVTNYTTPTCYAGEYSALADGVCQLCAAGQISTTTTAYNCSTCPSGYYTNGTGQTICLACAAGTYSGVSGAGSNATCTCGLSPTPHFGFVPGRSTRRSRQGVRSWAVQHDGGGHVGGDLRGVPGRLLLADLGLDHLHGMPLGHLLQVRRTAAPGGAQRVLTAWQCHRQVGFIVYGVCVRVVQRGRLRQLHGMHGGQLRGRHQRVLVPAVSGRHLEVGGWLCCWYRGLKSVCSGAQSVSCTSCTNGMDPSYH